MGVGTNEFDFLKTDRYDEWTYNFKAFPDGITQFYKVGKEAYDKYPEARYSWADKKPDQSFVGSSNKSLLDSGDFKKFENDYILKKAIDDFEFLFADIDMGGAFTKDKLIITDDKRGIFDFGLASKGLFRKQEYYSAELKEDNPFEFPNKLPGIVPWEMVYEDKMKQYWYTSEDTSKKYQLQLRQEGLTEILSKQPDLPVKELNGMLIPVKPIKGLKFGTTTKKAYVMFNKSGGKAKKVELYVGIGGLGNLNSEGMLARAMPLMLVSRYLEMAGIKTRINATRAYTTSNDMIMFTYPVKDYGEELNFNQIALNVADRRWFRWNLWKYTGAILRTEEFGKNSERPRRAKNFNGYGSTVYAQEVEGWQDMPGMLEGGNRYKNWYFNQMERGLLPPIDVSRNLMLFGGLEDPGNNLFTQRQDIIDEFFRVLDVVDFNFNKPEKAAERIRRRMVVEEGKSVKEFKNYVLKTLGQAYSYAAEGMYAASPERQDELDEEYTEVLRGVNSYLSSIKELTIKN